MEPKPRVQCYTPEAKAKPLQYHIGEPTDSKEKDKLEKRLAKRNRERELRGQKKRQRVTAIETNRHLNRERERELCSVSHCQLTCKGERPMNEAGDDV